MVWIIVYLISVIITFGLFFGHMQRKYAIIAQEYFWHDLGFSLFMALTSILGLTAFFTTLFENGDKCSGLLYPTPSYYKKLMGNDLWH